jgi:hypothetical protein
MAVPNNWSSNYEVRSLFEVNTYSLLSAETWLFSLLLQYCLISHDESDRCSSDQRAHCAQRESS